MTFSLPQSEDDYNRERAEQTGDNADWLEQLYDRIPPGFFDNDPVEPLDVPAELLDTNWPPVAFDELIDWSMPVDPINTTWLLDNGPNLTDPEFDTKVGIDLRFTALLTDEQTGVEHTGQSGRGGYDYLAPFLEADELDTQRLPHTDGKGNLAGGQNPFEPGIEPDQVNQPTLSPADDPDYSVPRPKAEEDPDFEDEPPASEWLGLTDEFDLDLSGEQAEVDFARRNSQSSLSPSRIMYVIDGNTADARRERLAENERTDTPQNTQPEAPPFLAEADYDPADIDRRDLSPSLPPLSDAQIEAEISRIEAELDGLERDKPDPTTPATTTPDLDL